MGILKKVAGNVLELLITLVYGFLTLVAMSIIVKVSLEVRPILILLISYVIGRLLALFIRRM